jgi:hypothetical protein
VVVAVFTVKVPVAAPILTFEVPEPVPVPRFMVLVEDAPTLLEPMLIVTVAVVLPIVKVVAPPNSVTVVGVANKVTEEDALSIVGALRLIVLVPDVVPNVIVVVAEPVPAVPILIALAAEAVAPVPKLIVIAVVALVAILTVVAEVALKIVPTV